MKRRDVLGAMSAAPVAWVAGEGRAQGEALPTIGILNAQSPGPAMDGRLSGFRRGLGELGYREGQNVSIDYKWADGRYERLRLLADELVRRKVMVIVAATQDAAVAAKAATATIPIVFNIGGDPVRQGLAASMNRPGGNATGISMLTNQLEAKRLGLLHEMAPRASAIGVLINPDNASVENQEREVKASANALGLTVHLRRSSRDGDLAGACDALVQAGADALMPAADPFFASQREVLLAIAARRRLPAIWEWPEFVENGGLMSYGTDIVDNYRLAGLYAARILKGTKPSDLPVLQPTKFVLAVNLRTARSLGLEAPPTLLARADNIVE